MAANPEDDLRQREMSQDLSLARFDWSVDSTRIASPGVARPTLRDHLREHLQGRPDHEQLAELLGMIVRGRDRHEESCEVVVEAWRYLTEHALWKADPNVRCRTLAAIRARLDEEAGLSEVLQAHQRIVDRRAAETLRIERQWRAPIAEVLGWAIMPPHLSMGLLKGLARLSQGVTAPDALELLKDAITARISRSGTKKTISLTYTDVRHVLEKELRDDAHGHDPLIARAIPSSSTVNLPSTLVCEDPSRATADSNLPPETTIAHSRGDTPIATVSSADRLHRKERHLRSSPSGDTVSSPPECPSRAVVPSSRCSCPAAFRRDYTTGKSAGHHSDETAHAWLALTNDPDLDRLCRLHLRALAGAFGLRNNVTNAILRNRLTKVGREEGGDLLALRARCRAWFRQGHRPTVPQDELLIYRFAPLPLPPFEFDPAVVMDRFAGAGAWVRWKRDGTLTLNGLFDHLADSQIRHQIDEEFAMYRHHEWVPSGKRRMGWMRHMFYSGVQQLLRMDPVWYALNAAARPDKQWRLISHPYITKDTNPGESTGFLHLDLNVERFVKDGSGGCLISTSVALDDETTEGCTVVVPGFHEHIHEWYRRSQARSLPRGGATTNCKTLYRKEDERTWGPAVPQPCAALGLRLTLPTLIHGSTPYSHRRRRSIFAWLTAIADDHETLPDALASTWSDLATCHRDMLIPAREPAASVPLHKVPRFAFPGSILIERVSPLAGALVGARRWTDRAVMQEIMILLGPDDAPALALARSIQAQLAKAYLRQWPSLVKAEKDGFGTDSYFGREQRRGDTALAQHGRDGDDPADRRGDADWDDSPDCDDVDSRGEGARGDDEERRRQLTLEAMDGGEVPGTSSCVGLKPAASIDGIDGEGSGSSSS